MRCSEYRVSLLVVWLDGVLFRDGVFLSFRRLCGCLVASGIIQHPLYDGFPFLI